MKRSVLSPKTIDGYETQLERYYDSDFLDLRLSELDSVTIQREVDRMAGKYSPKTVHNAHGLLSATIRTFFPDMRYNITLPKIQKRLRELPTAEQILPLFVGSDVELPVLLAVWLGLRMGEILGLKKSDFHGNRLTIRNTVVRVKGGKRIEKDSAKTVESRRALDVPPEIMELVNAQPTERITEMNDSKIYEHYIKIMEAAGFEGVTFHDLRHVNASTMLQLGIPDKYAMERGGWSTTSTLKRVYQETFSTERQLVDKKIDGHFRKIYKLATELATKNDKSLIRAG
jgi:integrase